jgi:hypothetical protein
MLAVASMGAPLPPEKLVELLRSMNRPKMAHTLRDDTDSGDGHAPGDLA